MTIPDEALRAAQEATEGGFGITDDYMLAALTAAAPFLQGVKPDPWVDTRLVRFDDTIVFGHGGLDFDRWESMRWEMHTRHGSFAVWKSGSKTWSMYGGKYGFLMLDRFSSEAEAKAEAEQIVISLDAEPPPRAQALEEAAILEALEECETYFDNLSDADHDETGFVANKEMRLLMSVRSAIRALSSQPVADGPERGKFYHKHWELSKLLEARNGGLVDHSGGEAWRYEYTSKDEHGKYDMLYRHNVNASVPARLPASPGASE